MLRMKHETSPCVIMLFICTVVCSVVFISTSGKAEEDRSSQRVLVATGDPWPPFADPKDPNLGIGPCILSKALTSSGSKIQILFLPWARAEIATEEGRTDVLINCAKTESREERFYFSDPYLKINLILIKRVVDPFVYTDLHSLSGKRVGTICGYAYPEHFLNNVTFYKDPVRTVSDNFKKLYANRVDLIVEDELVATRQMLGMPLDYAKNFEIMPQILATTNLHIATSRKNPMGRKIIELFNSKLKVIISSGEYQNIMKKYQAKTSSIQ